MKLVEPFKDMTEAVSELDNGGYFYNIFTSAKDGKITRSEISKAMHEFDDFDMLVLHLEMCLVHFSEEDKKQLFEKFDNNLIKTCEKHAVEYMTPSEIQKEMPISQTIITKANVKDVDLEGKTLGVTQIPMVMGDMVSYSTIPVIDTYDMYVVDGLEGDPLYVGVNRKGANIEVDEWYLGGILKRSELEDSDEDGFWFFEVMYFTKAN